MSWDGAKRPYTPGLDPGGIDGIRARVDNKVLSTCHATSGGGGVILIPADGNVTMWVALGDSFEGHPAYAQVGYHKNLNQSTVAFSEYNDGTCFTGEEPECSDNQHFRLTTHGSSTYFSPGTSKGYRVSYDEGPEQLEMFAAGVRLLGTPWDPYDTFLSTSWQAQVMGETHDPGDDVSGTESSRTLVEDIKLRHGLSQPWLDIEYGGLVSDQPFYWNEDVSITGSVSCSTWCFRVWTDRENLMQQGE